MNLPLFPEGPVEAPSAPPPPASRPVSAAPSTNTCAVPPVSEPSLPLSIRDIATLIQVQLRPLTAKGRQIVHAQWIRPGINAGARGFLSVTLADTEDTAVSIDGFIWERREVQAILEQGLRFAGKDAGNSQVGASDGLTSLAERSSVRGELEEAARSVSDTT